MIDLMMQPRFLRYAAALVAAFGFAACAAPRPPAFDAASEGAKLLKQDGEWAAAASAGKDVERVVSYWSDDAVVMEPGMAAIEGKPAIRAFVTQAFSTPGFTIHWASQHPTFSPDGKLAYMRGATETTLPDGKGGTVSVHNQGYSIWRMEPDGQWRCVVDIYTEAPAPPKAGKT